jgi:hypothetical protein
VRTAIARLAALALAAALPTAILHAEAALPGESCCNTRRVDRDPDLCCSGGAYATYESYSEVRDCDDRQGYRTTDELVNYRRFIHDFRQIGVSHTAGWYQWSVQGDGSIVAIAVTAGTSGAFYHDGHCTCDIDDRIANTTTWFTTNRVTKCTGGESRQNLIEKVFGDIQ